MPLILMHVYTQYISPCNGYKIIFKDSGHYFNILTKLVWNLKCFCIVIIIIIPCIITNTVYNVNDNLER